MVGNQKENFSKIKYIIDKEFRVELDNNDETMSKKVRDAQLEKVNYMITIGDKEEKAGTYAVRSRDGKVKFGVKPDDFVKELQKEISERK